MSDFLLELNCNCCGPRLLEALQRPYGTNAPDGESFALPWGSLAVLHERLVDGRNVAVRDGAVTAWVGDLLLGDEDAQADEVAEQMARLRRAPASGAGDAGVFFARLNGAFAIVSADNEGVSVVTDPLNALPVYFALDRSGEVVGAGTHPDAVACLGECVSSLDLASAGEFINRGTPLFPYTVHSHVKEAAPGSFHRLAVSAQQAVKVSSHQYWSPPPEMQNGCDREQIARELTVALRAAVRRRCRGRKVVVKLSGGLDSRVMLAGVPASADCLAVTFCDEINREAMTAHKVAQVYHRPWYPIFREQEYLANNLVKTVQLSGCQHEWVHAHAAGLAKSIVGDDVTCVLDGEWSNTFLRLYFVADLVRVPRLGGLLPAKYEKVAFDYADNIKCYCGDFLDETVLAQMRARRQEYQYTNYDSSRTSLLEWLDNYPLSQQSPLCAWVVERRLMPLRMVFVDRQVIELGFRCPLRFKFSDAFFMRATRPILGPGRRIPNANNGVRPGCCHVSRLVQRAVRKAQDQAAMALEGLGRKPRIEHSWHDYQAYWRDSKKLAQLTEEYGPNLDALDGVLFSSKARDLLRRKDLPWECGFRLLHLAVWLGIYRECRAAIKAYGALSTAR